MPWKDKTKQRESQLKNRPKYNENRRRAYAADPGRFTKSPAEYYRWFNIKKKYDLTKKDWVSLLKRQNSQCACCGADSPGKRGWHTDHDHVTNKVRGILCSACNMMLGLVHDNVLTLKRTIFYLENWYQE